MAEPMDLDRYFGTAPPPSKLVIAVRGWFKKLGG